jgi:hypothetical protein
LDIKSYWKFKYSKIYFSQDAGTQTAALAFGGNDTGSLTNTEEYNGSTWTSGK